MQALWSCLFVAGLGAGLCVSLWVLGWAAAASQPLPSHISSQPAASRRERALWQLQSHCDALVEGKRTWLQTRLARDAERWQHDCDMQVGTRGAAALTQTERQQRQG